VFNEVCHSSFARLGAITAGLFLRAAPRILQPLLLPQLQSPLLDEVNCEVLSSRKKIVAWRALDPIQDHLHVVYLILLFISRSLAAPLCMQVPLKLVQAVSPPSTTREGTKKPTWEVEGLIVSVQYLLSWIGLATCSANQGLLLQVKQVETGRVYVQISALCIIFVRNCLT
jgi:hypothetical protein